MLLISLFLLMFAAASAVLISLHPSRAVVRLRGTVVGFLVALGVMAAGADLVLSSSGGAAASHSHVRNH